MEITVKLDKEINETINLNFNGENYSVKTENGIAKLEFNNLANKNYTVSAELLNNKNLKIIHLLNYILIYIVLYY